MKPTQQQLLDAISYDPLTGSFCWTHHASVYVNVRGKPTATSGVKGHRQIKFMDQQLKAHHVAWCITHGYWPIEIDHENGIRDDNRIANLREATRLENQRNRLVSANSTTGFKGVSKRRYGGYEAMIQVHGKKQYLGKFLDPKDAARAYDQAALRLFGKFAKTNQEMGLLP